jgi:transposase-like protein
MSRNESDKTDIPNPEVVARPTQRRFSDEYKLRILEEADRCSQPGELGALLRREGLYSSHLSRWRQARAAGQLAGLKAKKRGPKTNGEADLSKEVKKLQREIERLQARLKQAETIIEVQKKLSQLLGLTSEIAGREDGR